jgi:hypothetical protein
MNLKLYFRVTLKAMLRSLMAKLSKSLVALIYNSQLSLSNIKFILSTLTTMIDVFILFLV